MLYYYSNVIEKENIMTLTAALGVWLIVGILNAVYSIVIDQSTDFMYGDDTSGKVFDHALTAVVAVALGPIGVVISIIDYIKG